MCVEIKKNGNKKGVRVVRRGLGGFRGKSSRVWNMKEKREREEIRSKVRGSI